MKYSRIIYCLLHSQYTITILGSKTRSAYDQHAYILNPFTTLAINSQTSLNVNTARRSLWHYIP